MKHLGLLAWLALLAIAGIVTVLLRHLRAETKRQNEELKQATKERDA